MICPLHAIYKQLHHYRMAQSDWPMLILQPMRSLAQVLNSLVQRLLITHAHY